MEQEKKNRVKGIFGTVLFHALLLLLLSLPFMSLTYQDPPPKKGGGSIAIDFSSQKATETNPDPVKDKAIESTEEIITQTTTDALVVKKTKKKKEVVKKEDPKKEEEEEEEEQKVNQQAMYSKKTTVTFEGRNPNADLGDLGNEGNGNKYQLGNRIPIVLPKPIYESEAEGKVVVRIIVDQFGNVISAITDIGTTLDKQLLVRAKEAALKTKYPPKADAPNQHGKLIYTFKKN